MKKRKEKKNLRSSFMILLLLAVFLIISTYAWFTTNKLVRVSPIDVNIEASIGFQISADAYNWKTVLNIQDFIDASTSVIGVDNHIPTRAANAITGGNEFTFDPVSTATGTNGTSGYMDMFLGEVSSDDVGTYMLTTTKITETTSGAESFIAFDLFFRTSADMELHLAPEAAVVDNADPALEASFYGKGIENSARIALVYQGYLPDTEYGANATATAVLARAMNYPAMAVKGGIYDPFTAGGTNTSGRNVKIWEPNSTTHTEASKLDIENIFEAAPGTVIGKQTYDGVFAATGADLDPTIAADGVKLVENNEGDNATIFKSILDAKFVRTVSTVSNVSVPGEAMNLVDTRHGNVAPKIQARTVDTPLGVNLKPGITKFRVYLWLEGQDWDCYDSAAGSKILWNLVLTSGDGTTTVDPDIAIVGTAKAAVGTNINIPTSTYADNDARAVVATGVAQGLVTGGVTVTVTWDGSIYEATFTKGAVTEVVTVTVTEI